MLIVLLAPVLLLVVVLLRDEREQKQQEQQFGWHEVVSNTSHSGMKKIPRAVRIAGWLIAVVGCRSECKCFCAFLAGWMDLQYTSQRAQAMSWMDGVTNKGFYNQSINYNN